MTKNTGLNQASASERAGSPKSTKITVRYELCTPLFTKRIDGSKPELSTPAVVGAVAFWWRALMWSQLDHKKNDAEKIKQLKDWEAALFGSAKTGQGAARFGPLKFFKIDNDGKRTKLNREALPTTEMGEGFTDNNGNRKARQFPGSFRYFEGDNPASYTGNMYLAGQGYRFDAEKQNPKAIWAEENTKLGFEFEVFLRVENTEAKLGSLGVIESLRNALGILGVIGGIGARSRRGFGSLKLLSMEFFEGEGFKQVTDLYGQSISNADISDLKRYICFFKHFVGSKIPKLSNECLAEYTALSKNSSFKILKVKDQSLDSVREVMDEVGHAYNLYRCWGYYKNGTHRVGSEEALWRQNEILYRYREDHDSYERARNSRNIPNNWRPGRAQYGLPLNFSKFGPELAMEIEADVDGRRASPLFFHFVSFGNETLAVLFVLPSRFLPKGRKLKGQLKDGRRNVGPSIELSYSNDADLAEEPVQFLKWLETRKEFAVLGRLGR